MEGWRSISTFVQAMTELRLLEYVWIHVPLGDTSCGQNPPFRTVTKPQGGGPIEALYLARTGTHAPQVGRFNLYLLCLQMDLPLRVGQQLARSFARSDRATAEEWRAIHTLVLASCNGDRELAIAHQ